MHIHFASNLKNTLKHLLILMIRNGFSYMIYCCLKFWCIWRERIIWVPKKIMFMISTKVKRIIMPISLNLRKVILYKIHGWKMGALLIIMVISKIIATNVLILSLKSIRIIIRSWIIIIMLKFSPCPISPPRIVHAQSSKKRKLTNTKTHKENKYIHEHKKRKIKNKNLQRNTRTNIYKLKLKLLVI